MNYLERFLENECCNDNTKTSYEFHIKQMLEFIGKEEKDITYGDLTLYKEHFLKKYSSKSMDAKIACIKSYFNYLYNEAQIINNFPIINKDGKKISIQKNNNPKKEFTYYDMEDVKKLVRFAKTSRDRAIIVTYTTTGLRATELINLTLEDYKKKIINIITKGMKKREIIFNDFCQRYIDEYLKFRKDCEYDNLFISNQETPMRVESLNRTLKNISKRAGLGEDIHNHTLRHTVVSEVLKSYDIETARRFIGHASINTTAMYVHSKNQEVRNVAFSLTF